MFANSRRFQSHCQNQVFRNLQPLLRSKGISSKRETPSALASYLLQEVALKLFLGNEDMLDIEFAPEREMDIVTAIYRNEYPALSDLARRRLRHHVVLPGAPSHGIKIVDITFTYDERHQPEEGAVFCMGPLSLDIPEGSRFGIVGPSGSGKTTLLRIVAGHLRMEQGTLFLGDDDISRTGPGHRRILTVFQDHALFPHLTVAKNIEFPLLVRRNLNGRTRALVNRYIDRFKLGHLREKKPNELSGGERQRTALARALVAEPAVLLLDEPTASLDAQQKRQLSNILTESLEWDMVPTIVIVTHDQDFAVQHCDELAIMKNGQVIAQGNTEGLALMPPNVEAAEVLDGHSVILGEVDDSLKFTAAHADIVFDLPSRYEKFRSSRCAILLRADALAIRPARGSHEVCVRGILRARHFRGPYTRLLIQVGRLELVADLSRSDSLTLEVVVRQAVDVAFPIEAVHVVPGPIEAA